MRYLLYVMSPNPTILTKFWVNGVFNGYMDRVLHKMRETLLPQRGTPGPLFSQPRIYMWRDDEGQQKEAYLNHLVHGIIPYRTHLDPYHRRDFTAAWLSLAFACRKPCQQLAICAISPLYADWVRLGDV